MCVCACICVCEAMNLATTFPLEVVQKLHFYGHISTQLIVVSLVERSPFLTVVYPRNMQWPYQTGFIVTVTGI